jgi:hypothetical protein
MEAVKMERMMITWSIGSSSIAVLFKFVIAFVVSVVEVASESEETEGGTKSDGDGGVDFRGRDGVRLEEISGESSEEKDGKSGLGVVQGSAGNEFSV